MEKQSGKTVLVTGSTDGVGRLVARKLGQAGARVLVHGRDAERGARVVAEIETGGGAADFLAADLSALAEVRRLAEEAQAGVDRLDILINNAGIGTAGPRQTSAEGFELRFAVNYLAGFLLTLPRRFVHHRRFAVEVANSSKRFLRRLERTCCGSIRRGAVVDREYRQQTVAHEFQDLSAMAVDCLRLHVE
jgi:NAD(P)-dependent dehydrogenase (short-subunit alcohol dehydrogenase family)